MASGPSGAVTTCAMATGAVRMSAAIAVVPCIRGTRIPVTTLVGMVAEGMTVPEILDEYPQLGEQDVREALRFAAAAVDERTLPFRPSA